MEKLKIYSAYLPYGLKLQYFDDEREILHNDCKMVEFREDEMTIANNEYQYDVKFYDVKPILFSLEDLTKEITINGETFVPIVELANEFTDDSFNDYYLDKFFKTEIVLREKYSRYYFKIQFKNDKIVGFDNNDTEPPQFDIFQKLLEWKFNIFNLPETEYIKVTEENNPYK